MDVLELAKLDGEKITLEKLGKIEENENVIRLDNLGSSGYHIGYIWFNVLVASNPNFEIDVYIKQ